MRLDATPQPTLRATSVEPSRAWILGLVVDADGSLSGASPEPEWPASSSDADAELHDQITPPDAPVRP